MLKKISRPLITKRIRGVLNGAKGRKLKAVGGSFFYTKDPFNVLLQGLWYGKARAKASDSRMLNLLEKKMYTNLDEYFNPPGN